ncbi:MAG: FimB/Mfa2 family fimbrial subunit [Prevotella sp.]
MKSIGTLFLSFAMTCCILSSCEKVDILEDGEDGAQTNASGVTRNVKLVAKAIDNTDVAYPLTIYAFDTEGNNVTSTVINGKDDASATLKLKKGRYHLTAVSLPSSYEPLSSVKDWNATFSMPKSGYATVPLMTGSADINVTSSDQIAHISLGYRQASLSVTINDVPTSVTSVDVTLSSAYTDMTLAADLSGKMMVTVPCVKGATSNNGATWSTGKFYILPSVNAQPSITISFSGGTTGDVSYSHTYNASLLAGTPYNFTATYKGKAEGGGGSSDDDVTINTDISAGQWADEVKESFNFGPDVNKTESPSDPESNVITVTTLPGSGDIWNGHVVGFVNEISETEREVVLISIKEWEKISSAFSSNANQAKEIAAQYEENGLSGWIIPTRNDGMALNRLYSYDNNRALINSALETCGGTGLIQMYGTSAVRYLCEDAEYTYSYKSATITKAGEKTTYYLRLVKYLKFVKK